MLQLLQMTSSTQDLHILFPSPCTYYQVHPDKRTDKLKKFCRTKNLLLISTGVLIHDRGSTFNWWVILQLRRLLLDFWRFCNRLHRNGTCKIRGDRIIFVTGLCTSLNAKFNDGGLQAIIVFITAKPYQWFLVVVSQSLPRSYLFSFHIASQPLPLLSFQLKQET